MALDASALIAFLRGEPGSGRVAAVLEFSCISAVNLSETYAKFVQHGKPLDDVVSQVERLQFPVIPFDAEQARLAASIWGKTRTAGLSLGDRACLSLAMHSSLAAFTADSAWLGFDLGVEIVMIR